jgi:hypothetical protein
VLLPASGAAAKALGQPDAKSSFTYGTLSNVKITNNGHTLQVSLPADFKSDVKIPIKGELVSLSCCHNMLMLQPCKTVIKLASVAAAPTHVLTKCGPLPL